VALLVELLQAIHQHVAVFLTTPPAILEFSERYGPDLVSIDQPPHFALQGLHLAFQPCPFALLTSHDRRIAPAFFVACPEQVGIPE